METIPATAFVAAGAITAALIGGLFVYINLILSKEMKISELRQNWIDALREELASYLAAVNLCMFIDDGFKPLPGVAITHWSERAKAMSEPSMNANVAYNRILMRLNPDEENEHQKRLIELLVATRDSIAAGQYDEAKGKFQEIRDKAQRVLKGEWERVKAGEPTFKNSKRVALALFAGALMLGGLFAAPRVMELSIFTSPSTKATLTPVPDNAPIQSPLRMPLK